MDLKTYQSGSYVRVLIPTTNEFLAKWHIWVHGKVSKHYKRDMDRIPDSVQRVRLRLLSKDFVSRWFYKHLTDDLVDLSEAMNMLGGVPITNVGTIKPVYGHRASPTSLWRVSDVLALAKFDYERYFYSVQNHTIDTNKVLRLLGFGPTISHQDYGILESLYRQGRIKPAELTEHSCIERRDAISPNGTLCGITGCTSKHYSRGYCSAHYGRGLVIKCDECVRGRMSLKAKGVSLASRWTDPSVAKAVSKLRWNDSQLTPFLRDWRNSNKIKCMPRYIIRDRSVATIDAGLLKYANMIIDNDVINHFKTMSRSEDLANLVVNNQSEAESKILISRSDSEDGNTEQEISNVSTDDIDYVDRKNTLLSIIRKACLTEDELRVIQRTDLEENSVKDVADSMSLTISRVNKLRSNALDKMRSIAIER